MDYSITTIVYKNDVERLCDSKSSETVLTSSQNHADIITNTIIKNSTNNIHIYINDDKFFKKYQESLVEFVDNGGILYLLMKKSYVPKYEKLKISQNGNNIHVMIIDDCIANNIMYFSSPLVITGDNHMFYNILNSKTYQGICNFNNIEKTNKINKLIIYNT